MPNTTAVPVRRSRRLAAKPRVNYSEMEEAPAPAVPETPRPTISVLVTVTEMPPVFDPVEKTRHVTYMKGMLERVVAATGDKATKAVIATELMHYIAAQCKDFCNAYPRFRDTVVSKCYEFKKFEGDQAKLITACNTVLRMFDRPLTVPEVLPLPPIGPSHPDFHKTDAKRRAEMEASYAKKKAEAAAKADEEAKAKVVPVDAAFLREHLRRIQGELHDAETEGYFHSLIGDYLRYVRKPEVLATLRVSPSDRMIARGIIRQYADDLCEHHQEDMDDFLYLCPV